MASKNKSTNNQIKTIEEGNILNKSEREADQLETSEDSLSYNKNFEKENSTTNKQYEKADKDISKDSLSYTFSHRNDLDFSDFKPKIAVIGVGGGGGNAVNAAIESSISDILTLTFNTDAQVLKNAKSDIVMQLGPNSTKGHGAGADPLVGKKSVFESEQAIKEHLKGVHVAFIVAGMGGGTGTGAAPEIARISTELGILTIGLVTTPFEFEGEKRMSVAKKGIVALESKADILVVINNQSLFGLSTEETTLENAFELTDNVLCSGLRSFIHTIKEPSRINVDIADFFTIMKGKHARARMGTGLAEGANRGEVAAQLAMSSPLLDLENMNASAITAIIICIRCGRDTTLNEVNKAVASIRGAVHKDANIIFGASLDDALENQIEVSLFATLDPKFVLTSSDEKDVMNKNVNYESDKINNKNVVIESFEGLLSDNIGEDEYLGTPHSFAVNESPSMYKSEKKVSIFKKAVNFLSDKCDAFLNIIYHKDDDDDDDSKTSRYM